MRVPYCDYCDNGCRRCRPQDYVSHEPQPYSHEACNEEIARARRCLRTVLDYLDYVESCTETGPPVITHTARGDSIADAFNEAKRQTALLLKVETEQHAAEQRERARQRQVALAEASLLRAKADKLQKRADELATKTAGKDGEE